MTCTRRGAEVRIKTRRITADYVRNGYPQTYLPDHPMAMADGYVPTHRLVMSEHLGRLLLKPEHVHHIDGNKLNYDIKNLEIISLSKHVQRHWDERKTSCKYCGTETCSLIATCKRCWDQWNYRHKKDNKKHDKEICPFCI